MICRLCLKNTTDGIHIFQEEGTTLNVAALLSKYIWFELKEDDTFSTDICRVCWTAVHTFHEFYLTVEEAQRLLSERLDVKDDKVMTTTIKLLSSIATVDNFNADDNDVGECKFEPPEEFDFLETLMDKNQIKSQSSTPPAAVEFELAEADEDVDRLSPDNEHTLRRSTRHYESLANFRKNDKRKLIRRNSTEFREANVESSETPKKRRGRPRKNAIAIEDQSGNETIKVEHIETEPKAKTKTSASQIESNSEAKLAASIDADAKILQYMQLVCDVCAAQVSTFSELRSHMSTTHQRKGFALCCGKKFFKRVLLLEHIEKHLNPDCYNCKECGKVFADKQCMRNHFLVKHQPDELKIYACSHCPKKFAKPYLLEQHRVRHNALTHVCELCQRAFPTTTMLESHKKIVHGNYGTMCDICAKVIRGRAAFARHQLEHTGIVLPKVQCHLCGSWHKDKHSLQKHVRRHKDEGGEHVCNVCGKVAPNRSALLSHKRYVHTSERSFVCSVCEKAFKKAIGLKEHMATHTGEVLYNCPHCSKTFNSNANMHSHRKKVHPKEFLEARINRRHNNGVEPIIQTATVPVENNSQSNRNAERKSEINSSEIGNNYSDEDGEDSIIYSVSLNVPA